MRNEKNSDELIDALLLRQSQAGDGEDEDERELRCVVFDNLSYGNCVGLGSEGNGGRCC